MKALGVVLGALVLVGTFVSPAGAAVDESSSTDQQTQDDSDCVLLCDGKGGVDGNDVWADAVVFTSGGDQTRPVPAGSSYFVGCLFEMVPAGVVYVTGRNDSASVNVDGSMFSEDQWVIFCPDRVGQGPLGFDAYTFYAVGDPPPAPVIDAMITDAYQRTPVVAFNPISSPPGDNDIPLVTQLTTFLWVDEQAWVTPVSATATVPGFFVTTTATPAQADWSGGADPATCEGADMVPYQVGIGGDDAQPSQCAMVYKQSSALADHELTLAVTWAVSFTCSIPVCGGPLPDITITSSRPVLVQEIQAIETDSS